MFIDVIILLAAASLLLFLLPPRWKAWYAVAVTAAGAAAAVFVAATVFMHGPLTYYIESLPVLGDTIAAVDRLSALFLVMISLASVAAAIYSAGYLKDDFTTKSPVYLSLHYLSYVLLVLSMFGVVIFRSAFAFLLSWEVMTLSSFLLVMYDAGRKKVMRTAISYLTVMHAGFFFLLAGFVKLSAAGLPAGFDSLASYFAVHKPMPLFLLFFVGFGLKAGVFPLHTWLPEAHPAAPSHVSALMSGVMIKMGVYGILRVTMSIGDGLFPVALVVLGVGIVTALWGVIYASIQDNLKKLLAYSSIENIGIIMIAIGAGLLGKATGDARMAACCLAGALLHTLFHSFFKPLLFMGAGSVIHATGGLPTMDRYGGLMKRMPVTGFLFLAGTIAIAALPPLNGFVSEFMIYSGLISGVASDGGATILALVTLLFLSLVGGLALVVFCKAFGITFLGTARSCPAEEAHEANPPMIVGMAVMLAAVLCSGFLPAPFVAAASGMAVAGYHIPPSAPIGVDWTAVSIVFASLCVGAGGLYWIKKRLQAPRTRAGMIASGPTWGCGYGGVTKKMQYTGESYTQPLRELAPVSGKQADSPVEGIFPKKAGFRTDASDRINTIVEHRWMRIVRRISSKMALFQTGHVNHYILHALLFIMSIFALSFIHVI